ncbi:MAG: zinc finger domain-containing protein [Candidatus Thiodiazotropha endolucinida]|nr:zinc finger domain-containing protein [Candidatus Thiodiazotropha taylori]MCW4343372.1 zinc finger domain-containing protein [Candidatus Thiodiazotropha endolucinida]
MGPKKVISKDDSALDTLPSSTNGDMSEKLLEAYTETENVRRRNAQLEIQFRDLEAVLREKDLENKYLNDRMEKEMESVIRERDTAMLKMQDDLKMVQMQLAEERQRRENAPSLLGGLRAEQPEHQNLTAQAVRNQSNFDIPLPRQMVYDGKSPYEMFIRSFLALADTCGWDDKERAFRMLNTLRGEAADFVFTQVDPRVQHSFYALEHALEARFKERRSETSFLAELESRKLGANEKVSEYVADIKRLVRKGYPTADERTFNKIALRHFIRGLTDQQMVLAVGMKDPKTVEEAQNILDTYNSLKDETKTVDNKHGGAVRAKAVWQNKPVLKFITESRLNERLTETEGKITKLVDHKMEEIAGLIKKTSEKPVEENKAFKRRDMSTVECFKCHGFGHYARNCEARDETVALTTGSNVPENWD